jgi:16S rRNA pseudouridine516 synthase
MKNTERLDKVLSHMGWGSRSEIRKLVKQKTIYVNQKLIKDSGYQVHPEEDEIEVEGKKVVFRHFIYVMMNKPQGVISATEDSRDKTVVDLLDEEYKNFQPFPVGRLDKDTEGLLLLTNDGKLAHDLLSPKKHVEKTYYVEVIGELNQEDKDQLLQGVTLEDGYAAMPAKLNFLETGSISKAEITIMEGKFHQVKRMFKQLGKQVIYLKRIRMGPLLLDPLLALGNYRELSEEEVAQLKGGKDEI